MKNKILVVDNDYSRISGSTQFIHSNLKKDFEYDLIWDQKWTKSINYDRERLKNYETIIFVHSFLPFNYIYNLRNKNIIWVPMYDSLCNLNQLNPFFWKLIKKLDVKIVSFSSVVKKKCLDNNINFYQIKYFLEPKPLVEKKNKLKILFWDRGEIKFSQWIKFFEPNELEKITIINRPDPGKKISLISKSEIINYKIEILNIGYIDKEIYLKILGDHDIFISPRYREGIGIAYLEALSYSMYILANKKPTMNDYITNENIGLFFCDNKQKNITSDFIHASKKIRYQNILENFEICKNKLNNLNKFIENKINKKNDSIYMFLNVSVYEIIYRIFFLIKRLLLKINILK